MKATIYVVMLYCPKKINFFWLNTDIQPTIHGWGELLGCQIRF